MADFMVDALQRTAGELRSLPVEEIRMRAALYQRISSFGVTDRPKRTTIRDLPQIA